MKHLPTIAAALLGLMFVAFGLLFFFPQGEMPQPPAGSPMALFMGALAPTGYLAFVKVLEILGGALLIPGKTRNLGLLLLGPVIVNILATHIFIMKGANLADPVLITVCVLAAFVLWSKRSSWSALLRA